MDSGHNGRHTAIAWSPESVGGEEGDSVIRCEGVKRGRFVCEGVSVSLSV